MKGHISDKHKGTSVDIVHGEIHRNRTQEQNTWQIKILAAKFTFKIYTNITPLK